MTTFALVHGAWHGSWCWDRVVPELEARGHGVVTVDLPSQTATAGMTAYRDVVLDALDGLGEDVVLVGHSLGGITVPLVGAARPVRRVVYLTPAIPAVLRVIYKNSTSAFAFKRTISTRTLTAGAVSEKEERSRISAMDQS